MKKTLSTLFMMAGMAVSASAGWMYPIDWGSDAAFGFGSGPDVIGPDGLAVPTTSTWHAEIVDKLTPTVVYYTATHDAGSGFWNQVDTGVAYQSLALPDTADGRTLVTRIYNDPVPGSATQWFVYDPVTPVVFDWDPAAATPPSGGDAYNFQSVAQGSWVAVPEPGAASLLILGAGMFLARRVRARHAL